MQDKIIAEIRLNNENPAAGSSRMLSCLYYDRAKEKIMYIDHSWSVKPLAGQTIDNNKVKPNDIPISEHGYYLRVGEHGNESSIMKLVEFFKGHTDVDDFNRQGFEYGSTGLLIEVFGETADREIEQVDLYSDCYEAIRKMTDAELKDVCYYFQVPKPEEMTTKQLRASLVGPTQGKLKPTATANHKRFLEVYGDTAKSEKSHEAQVRVDLIKAQAKKYVTVNNGMLYIGQVMIGADQDKAVMYLQNNKQMYDAMVLFLKGEGDQAATKTVDDQAALIEKFGPEEIEFMKNEIVRVGKSTNAKNPDKVYKAYVSILTEKGDKPLSPEKVVEEAAKVVE